MRVAQPHAPRRPQAPPPPPPQPLRAWFVSTPASKDAPGAATTHAPTNHPQTTPIPQDTVVQDPFFEHMPRFFDLSFHELLATKHPTAWIEFEKGQITEQQLFDKFFQDGRGFDGPALVQHMVRAADGRCALAHVCAHVALASCASVRPCLSWRSAILMVRVSGAPDNISHPSKGDVLRFESNFRTQFQYRHLLLPMQYEHSLLPSGSLGTTLGSPV